MTGTMGGPSVTVTDFEAAGLDTQLSAIDDAISTHLDGTPANVAVVGEPFAGRDVLLSYAADMLNATDRLDDTDRLEPTDRFDATDSLDVSVGNVTFEDVVTDLEAVDLPNTDVVFVEGCHYLYTRRIGGFDVLDAFLERITKSESVYVTEWNRWAWDYLVGVRDVQDAFSDVITIPRLEAPAMRALVREHVDEIPEFVETDAYGRMKTLEFERESLGTVGDREISIPVPQLHLEYLSTIRSDEEAYGDVERVVFERLTRTAEGNAGVALALWADAVRDGTIAASHFDHDWAPLRIDDDEALVLASVLTNERITLPALEAIYEEHPVAQAIHSIAQQSLVTVEDDVVSVTPTRFHESVDCLEGRRLLW